MQIVQNRRLRLGIAGLGRAFTLMLPTLAAHPRVEMVAAADPRAEARESFARDYGGRAYRDVDALCADPSIEAIYVATPHQHHAAHAVAAARNGKHVLVEKPMTLTLADASTMIEAAERAGVHLVVGHSHSFDAPIARAREIIASGGLGPVRMITAMNFTDFLYRPRRPEELDTSRGGGVIFSQAAHQVDIVRLLGGGRVKSVRAATGAWDAARPTEGAYSALLTFADGTFASLTYSGYGHFDGDEFCDWVNEVGRPKDPSVYGAMRKALAKASDAEAESAAKNARNYGGSGYAKPGDGSAWHEHFGLIVASCERGDVRPTPKGVLVYGDERRQFHAMEKPAIPRSEVIDELYEAIFAGRAPLHDGRWGRATLEVCLAMLRSGREQREVPLEHQVPVP